jgi:hypothetical protein
MDVCFSAVHALLMTTFLIVFLLLVVLAVAGPLFGADTRASGWTPSEAGQKLWTRTRISSRH